MDKGQKGKFLSGRKGSFQWVGLFLVFWLWMGGFVRAQEDLPFIRQGCLTLTFPTDIDTTELARIRLAGHLSDSGRVWINGKEVRVFPSRAFVDRIALHPGINRIEIVGQTLTRRDTLILSIYRLPPALPLPERPTTIAGDFLAPSQDVVVYESVPLYLRFRGSPGGVAEARISGLDKHIPMREVPPERAMGMKGIYEGIYLVPVRKRVRNKRVEFRLRGLDGKTKKVKTEAKITVDPQRTFVVGRTARDDVPFRTRPGGVPLCYLPEGIRVRVVSRQGNFYRVRLSQTMDAFVAAQDLQLLPPGVLPPFVRAGGIRIAGDSDWVHIDIRLSDRCAFTAEQLLDPNELVVTLFGAGVTRMWNTYPGENRWVKWVRLTQTATDQVEIRVRLKQHHWGYRVRFTPGGMRISLRKAPRLGDNPFQGVIIAVDAGHGGEQLGAVGATGLLEKDVNLKVARYLASELDTAGATVFLTRDADTTLSLQERIRMAEKRNAHLFIWCHNNSAGAASDPLAVRGTSTYFTQWMGKRLAELTLPHLLNLGLPNFGEIQALFYVTRQTGLVTFLVEGAFLSNPLDEMLLMDDGFLRRLAHAVFLGIRDFLVEQRALQRISGKETAN
jgi:N-acetylmuramoyl-L-alanine amidase